MAKKDTMKNKTDVELEKLVVDTRAAIRTERFAAAGARAKDPNAALKFRKTIARALTEQLTRSKKAAAA